MQPGTSFIQHWSFSIFVRARACVWVCVTTVPKVEAHVKESATDAVRVRPCCRVAPLVSGCSKLRSVTPLKDTASEVLGRLPQTGGAATACKRVSRRPGPHGHSSWRQNAQVQAAPVVDASEQSLRPSWSQKLAPGRRSLLPSSVCWDCSVIPRVHMHASPPVRVILGQADAGLQG